LTVYCLPEFRCVWQDYADRWTIHWDDRVAAEGQRCRYSDTDVGSDASRRARSAVDFRQIT
jgi:hypothetical protein